ncbi:MAG: ribonuclease E/G, partial [Variovorax sp.]
FNHDIGDILIDTDDIYEQAQQFMAHVMPEHAARVKRYRDDAALFSRFQIEHQIESAYARTVQLPSGGAIVIDHTEALVSVDVNSARAIKGGDIEETATRTNLEAADEVARQMRLRDLGGLIVIDFIDMDESKNRREVESRLRDALRQDRARVQFGSISKFGLMEMSRQRLKPALSEGSSIPCPRCGGSGHIRDTESSALQILRIIQEECLKDNTAAVHVQVPVDVASFLLNEKRPEIAKIELKQRVTVVMKPNKTLETPNYRLERLKHDDPRLDHIEASYKVDEIEDPTSITRRSQEPTNKQTPVIKGVLPDAPAPIAVPKPEPVRAPVAVAPAPVAPAPVAAAPAETGLLAWIKSLFGVTPAPAPAAAPTVIPVEAPKPARRDGRPPRDGEARAAREGEPRRGGEGRGGRGGRGGERREGGAGRTGERRDGERREPRAEGRNEQPREQREPREGRNGPRDGERRSGRGGERREADARAVAPEALEGALEVVQAGELPAAPRSERAPRGRGERGDRGGERRERNHNDAPRDPATTVDGAENAAPERAARPPRGERGGEGRRDRREDEARPTDEAGLIARAEPVGEANAESHSPAAEPGADAPRRDGEERRSRSRDRYGRDRRERAPREGTEEAASTDAALAESQVLAAEPAAQVARESEAVVPRAIEAPVPAPSAPASIRAPEPAVVSAAAVALAGRALPKVQPFELPLAELAQVAEGSGLQWVNSDAERIAQVRAQIAAEPKAIHIPRERPPAVVLDEGPLVLVETRRDLSAMSLPFEQAAN